MFCTKLWFYLFGIDWETWSRPLGRTENRVFENRVLRRTFGSKRGKRAVGDVYLMRSFTVCSHSSGMSRTNVSHSRFLFGRTRTQILPRIPAVLNEFLRGFPQFFQEYAWIISQIKPQLREAVKKFPEWWYCTVMVGHTATLTQSPSK
jgi:hypothetical protein